MNSLMWHLRRTSLIGLDIDASTVRMVQWRRDDGGRAIAKAGIMDIAPAGNDPELRRIHTIRAIVNGLAHCGIRSKLAVCGLRGPEVVVRSFEFPALPAEEIEGAVQLEVSQICPFLAEESTLDYQVTSSTDKSTAGFWVAATNSLIQETRELVSAAGLHCALVDVTGLALLNLLESHLRRDTSKASGERSGPAPVPGSPSPAPGGGARNPSCNCPTVLNLGDSCATIAIADAAGRPFVRDLGGAILDRYQSLAATRCGSLGSCSSKSDWTARIARPSMPDDSLVEDLATTLRYYVAQNGSMRIDRLLVCGSRATEGFVALLRTRLNIEVERWNPLAQDGGQSPIDLHPPSPGHQAQEEGSSLAVAAGLALRHA